MAKPKIGFKTWNLAYDGPGKVDLDVIEIASKDKNLGFRRKSLDDVKRILKNKDASMHTQTKRVFTDKSKTLRELELSMLKTEVLACGYIGCKELIVHLKQHKLTAVEVKSLSDLLKFAKKNKVEILYEPNSNFDGRNYLYNLKKVPPLNANLDLCHLAMALENKTLGMDLREFLKKVRDRVVYVHASGYDGVTDHIGLRKGKLDWIDVLDQLNMSKIRKIIIELHDFGDFKETKKAIDSYVRKR